MVGTTGLVFFHRNGNLPPSDWIVPWFALLAASAVNLWLSQQFAFLEGCGRIGEVARMRTTQSIIGYLLMWAALLSGAGLYSIPIVPLVAGGYSLFWLTRHGKFIKEARLQSIEASNRLSWTKEVLPLQWRISLSWASSYLIFNFFTPVVFARAGEIQAGHVGMSLAIFNAITSIGMSWVNAKAPQLSMLAAVKRIEEMKSVFQNAMFRSAAAVTLTIGCFLLSAVQLRILFPKIGSRLLSSDLMLYLAAVALANCLVFCAATYMRSFKREPMLPVSVVTGILSGMAIYAGSNVGVTRMLQLYAGVIVLVCLPWTLLLLKRFYKEYA